MMFRVDARAEIERLGFPVTRSVLRADLAHLGVRSGATVMFHTRLSALGYVAGGARSLVAALLDVVGPTGTLMVVCGWQEALPYDFPSWPKAWRAPILAEHPAFDRVTAEAAHEVGRLPEALRRWPGAVRSDHPDASFAALGPAAHRLMDDHPLDHAFGGGSPLARLVELGGAVLMLGAPLETMTLLHHAEALADLPNKRFVAYEQPILADGERVWRRFRDIDSEHGAFDYDDVERDGEDAFAVIGRDMLDAGVGVSGRVAGASAHLIPAGEAVRFAIDWLETNLPGRSATG
jgi:aminoglycoside 3-N-acetyltransferase